MRDVEGRAVPAHGMSRNMQVPVNRDRGVPLTAFGDRLPEDLSQMSADLTGLGVQACA